MLVRSCSTLLLVCAGPLGGCAVTDVEPSTIACDPGQTESPLQPTAPGTDLPSPDESGPGCVTATWAGDILLADAAFNTLQTNGYGHPFEHVGELLSGDVVIGNAEGPITERTEQANEGQQWHYNALPAAADALAAVGFDALSIANNHLHDRGPQGIEDTLFHLDAVEVVAFGGGLSRDDALVPFVFDAPVGLVAVFGFGKSSNWVPAAGDAQAGMLVLNSTNASAARAVADELGADYVVAFPHWGSNYSNVSGQQRGHAELLIDAGFDLIVGHGPHNQQGVEYVDGVPVLWSLGNFAFGTPGRWDEAFPGYGLVATTVFEGGGLERVELHCIVTDNDVVAFQPIPCEEAEAVSVLEALGDVQVEGGVGVWR
ncbi:MAG: CapA family protein [Deltaproteobacteria bacterium]|nr:CapA family protein [Deltaproteobacteria bacterium]